VQSHEPDVLTPGRDARAERGASARLPDMKGKPGRMRAGQLDPMNGSGILAMLHGRMFSVFAALSLCSLASPTFAQGGQKALYGFRDFCRRHSSECRPAGPSVRQVAATAQRMSELQQINLTVNRSVEEISDREQFGQEDVWSLPATGRGDCEDYALMKRKLLIERGWPSSALLLTAALTPQGEWHLVLTAVTDKGDYVLDNLTDTLRTTSQAGYTYLSRQSPANPWAWVSVTTGEQTREPVADFPVRRLSARDPNISDH
jgi:predicted transglutaminase-like cysteine proteinase